jgi:hypothetical protein
MPGQGANICNLGRAARFAAFADQTTVIFGFSSRYGRGKNQRYRRMAPMTGILLPPMTESRLAKPAVTP